MVVKWFRTIEGKKALATGYVIALVVIVFEAIRYVITLMLFYLDIGAGIYAGIYSYLIGALVVIVLLYFLIRKCDW